MGKWSELIKERKYSLYVLALLLITYLLNQVDRYTLAIVSKEAEQDIGFGDGDGSKLCAVCATSLLVFTLSGLLFVA